MRRTRDTSVVVFDLETTGLRPEKWHRIIEIGAVRLIDRDVMDEFSSLVRPDRTVPRTAAGIHGLTDRDLSAAPPPEEVFPRFAAFIKRSTLVAHNAAFDVPFLRKEFSRFNLRFGNPVVCTLKMARRLLPDLPDYRLETVARRVIGSLPEETRLHRALDDARLAAGIWLKLCGEQV